VEQINTKSKTLKLYPIVVGLLVVGAFSLVAGAIATQYSWKGQVSDEQIVKEFAISNIDTLISEGTADIEIIQGDKELIVATGKKSYVSTTNISTSGNTVTIKQNRNPRVRIIFFGTNDETIKYTVYVKSLKKIENKGVGSYEVDAFSTDSLSLINKGVGSMVFNKLKATRVEVTLDGTGSIELSGETDTLQATLEGVGSLEAFPLTANYCDISLHGVGAAEINCEKTMKGSVYGVGSISYRGNASIEKTVRGLGTIDQE